MVTAVRPDTMRRQPAKRRELPEYRHGCDRLLFKGALMPGTEIEVYCDRCKVPVRVIVNCDPIMPFVLMQDAS
jgi:3-hydroxymyristoyl/3-hydroxydecanoyl-(acyl carrier protein) dehydratase